MSLKGFSAVWHLGSLRQWHWISSAVCLVGMLLFSVTGITLNNAAIIPATPVITSIEAVLPQQILDDIELPEADKAPLNAELRGWLESELNIYIAGSVRGEWSDEDVYVALPRPGGDAWLSLDLTSGDILYERTTRGWVAYLNDLHKGRDTGAAWSWFIDVFAIACVVFCVSGLLLLQRHAASRPSTWPMVGLGLVIPLILIILFVH
jgi:hypothetical protein